MTCNCITEIDGQFDSQELPKIDFLDGRATRVFMSLIRKDSNGKYESRKGKPKWIAATFCPFCGESYEPQTAKTSLKPMVGT